MTFSAGVAEFPTDGTDWTTLYRIADDSLTQAKTMGRNRVVGGTTRKATNDVVPNGVCHPEERSDEDLSPAATEPPRAR